MLDYNGDDLPDLAKHIESTYPGVGVRLLSSPKLLDADDATQVTTISADASDANVIEDLCQRAFSEHSRLDVFFANAGVASIAPLDATDPADLPDIFRVNIVSCFVAVQSAARVMAKSGGGSIIMTASVAGLRSGAGSIDYSARCVSLLALSSPADVGQ